jgi:hypothetical protein
MLVIFIAWKKQKHGMRAVPIKSGCMMDSYSGPTIRPSLAPVGAGSSYTITSLPIVETNLNPNVYFAQSENNNQTSQQNSSETYNNDSNANTTKGSSEATKVEYGEQYAKVDGRKALKSNVEYSTEEGYKFTTDSNGRISSAEADLELGKAERNTYAQRTVGGEDRLPNDDGGHLIAKIFKGSGELDNLVPMNSTLNKGEYKWLEYTWKKALEEGKKVKVKIEPIYQENSMRPSKFKVDYTIDGKAYSERLTN